MYLLLDSSSTTNHQQIDPNLNWKKKNEWWKLQERKKEKERKRERKELTTEESGADPNFWKTSGANNNKAVCVGQNTYFDFDPHSLNVSNNAIGFPKMQINKWNKKGNKIIIDK